MINALRAAIESRKPITFSYNKPGKVIGMRKGNPHAVFIMQKKDGTESTKVHIVQTHGVTDSGQALPSFRMFDVSELSDICILEQESSFAISHDYNALWPGYSLVIAKV